MKLPSPTSVTNQLDNLSFKSNTKHGWQKVGKESISGVCGCVNASLGFPESFYIDSNGRILRTNFFGSGAIGSTVGDGGSPQGSTELDSEAGYNCELPRKQHRLYCTIVCALDPKGYGIRRNNNNAYNTKLNDLYCLINTIPTRGSDIPGDREHMAVGLARFCFHYIGSKALTQAIIDEVWQERAIELGGERGDLEIIRRRAICDCSISINLLHIWSAPDDENQQILGDITFLTPPLNKIFKILQTGKHRNYVREPICTGEEIISILMDNLRNHSTHPESAVFEQKIVQWYRDLLLNCDEVTDETGVNNGIFAAFGLI